MSWSLTIPANLPAPVARAKVEEAPNVPQPVKDYVIAGIEGLVDYKGDENTPVTITGYGHICENKSYEVTTCTLEVKPGTTG